MSLVQEQLPAPSPPIAESSAVTRESLEDYTLRFAPRSYRKWGAGAVAVSALGGIAYLADFSIGATIGLTYGTPSALVGIVTAAIIIFLTGFPLAYYAARYNLDLDLITRGCGFGYYGSIISNVIFASFTFIFFALEGAIMAQGLYLGLGVPLWAGYAVSTLIVLPLVMYGMKVLTTVQMWTTPLWLVLMIVPVLYLVVSHPESIGSFLANAGSEGHSGVDFGAAMLAAGVCLSLIAQIAEQIDYLRFMPAKTPANARTWWRAVIVAGPGWVVFGAAKQILGMFLAVHLVSSTGIADKVASEPVHQFLALYDDFLPPWAAIVLSVCLVVLSQVKINVTNAYSGSLAWTNAYTRITRHYPGRLVFVVVNLGIALVLMEANMFSVLNTILSFYANCAISWIVVVAVDIMVNKYLLGLSPKAPEFRRGMLPAVNPVGVVSMSAAAIISIACYFGALGSAIQPYSAIVAVVIAAVATPVMAVATQGRYYLRRSHDGIDLPMYDEHGNPSAEKLRCHVSGVDFERPDMMLSSERAADGQPQYISSLCLATDRDGRYVLPPTS